MSADDRLFLAMSQFESALRRLQDALAQPENEFIRDAVIQRFEFTFEMAWKAMYRWLRARDISVEEGAYSVIPQAFRLGLLTDERQWGSMRLHRNKTSHTYNEPVALEVAAFVRGEAVALFEALLTRLKTDPA